MTRFKKLWLSAALLLELLFLRSAQAQRCDAWDWTEDCWNPTNAGNSGDGSPRLTGDCSLRVIRGAGVEQRPLHPSLCAAREGEGGKSLRRGCHSRRRERL